MKGEKRKRVEAVICAAFGGEYNTRRPEWHDLGHLSYFECRIAGTLSTFDGSVMTSLVMAAHKYAVRVELSACNMQYIRIRMHPRKRREEDDHQFAYHPTVEEMLERRGYLLAPTATEGES